MVVWVVNWRREVWIHGKECDMTYSRPNYIPISTEGNSFYRLYQFVDWDDIFHRSLLHSPKKLELCTSNDGISIVLFVPGYGGSYKQVRSLGNHIIRHPQYRNIEMKIVTLEWINDGSIWHADLLQHYALQLQQLLQSCSASKITIVAHSIGGIISRIAVVQNETTLNIKLITLATPHVQFPYTYFWDTTNMQHYNVHDTANNSNTISISGGIRDELIPPVLTYTPNHTNNVILVPNWGMDHQAIVWCHSALHTLVDQYIFNSMNVVQTKTLQQIQTEALKTHGIISNGLLLFTMPYTIFYILFNIYPTTILLHHFLQLFTKRTTKAVAIMTFILQSLFQSTLWTYPYYYHFPKNTTFTIIFTCYMNAIVTVLYFLHRRSLGIVCNFFGRTHTTKCRRSSWNKLFTILFIICFISSYCNDCGGYITILVQIICHVWTIWTFLPLSLFMRQNNNHLIVMTLMAFFPMYCVYMIRQCIIYYFYYTLDVVTSFKKMTPSFLISHIILPLWNQIITTFPTTTTSKSNFANYRHSI